MPCYISVAIVIVLYVLVAAVTVGTLSSNQVSQASDHVLAAAARPALGGVGFALVAVAALLSTSSAINATLYGTTRLSWSIAHSGELPEVLEEKTWNRPIDGLLITTGLTLVVANAFDLSRIALMGSGAFLIVFAAVNAAAARTARRRARRALAVAGGVTCVVALAALAVKEASRDLWGVVIVVALVVGSFAIEALYRLVSPRGKRSADARGS